MGGLQGIPAAILSRFDWCEGYTKFILHFTAKTYHAFKAKQQPSFNRLRFVYKQAKYAQRDRKR